MIIYFFFFFQAEDGIRDLYVTGVQTCALPISIARLPSFGMMNDNEDEPTFRGWIGIAYFVAISRNIRPSQSSAREVMRSGTIESFAQQNAAVTALPPNETA